MHSINVILWKKKALAIFIPSSVIDHPFSSCEIRPVKPYEIGVKEYKEDFEYFYDMIRDNYPYTIMRERMLGYSSFSFLGHK